MAAQTAVAAGGAWTKPATWSPEGAPTNTSDCKLDATSATTGGKAVEITATALARTIDCTGFANTLTQKSQITIGGAGQGEGTSKGIALKLVSGMTFTLVTGTPKIIFNSSSSAVEGIWCGGKTLPITEFKTAGTPTQGKWRFEDKFIVRASDPLIILRGEIDTNTQEVEVGRLEYSGVLTASLTLTSSKLKLTGTGVVYTLAGEGITITGLSSATVEVTDTSATEKSLSFNKTGLSSQTLGKLIVTGDNVVVAGTMTITTLELLNAGAATGTKLKGGLGASYTISNFVTNAKAGSLCKLTSTEAGQQVLITNPTPNAVWDYMEFKDIANSGQTIYSPHGVDLGNNTGIVFGPPPVAGITMIL